MSKRSNPAAISMPERAPHEKKLDEMHDVLYKLGDKARSKGSDKLLPKSMKSDASEAIAHINKLHDAMKSCGGY